MCSAPIKKGLPDASSLTETRFTTAMCVKNPATGEVIVSIVNKGQRAQGFKVSQASSRPYIPVMKESFSPIQRLLSCCHIEEIAPLISPDP
jgi:hypothetical protein